MVQRGGGEDGRVLCSKVVMAEFQQVLAALLSPDNDTRTRAEVTSLLE